MGTSRWKENIFELLKGPHSEFNRLQTIERNCFQFLVLKVAKCIVPTALQ